MRKIFKLILLTLQSALIFIVIGATSYAITKNIHKIILVEQFKSKGEYQEDISTDDLKFYRIESNEEVKAFRKNNNKIYPGFHGDILVSTQATLINPLISGLISFYAGGHAAVCIDYSDTVDVSENMTIEASGVNGDDEAQLFNKNYWVYPNIFNEVIGLRMDMNNDERNQFVDNATKFLGYPYNYSFIFNTKNSIYCSDLVSRSAKPLGFNLNKDNGTTTIYDLIVSNDTYIFYYHYFDNEGVQYIYYLD
jgi:uncharacterized protein YycO